VSLLLQMAGVGLDHVTFPVIHGWYLLLHS
jgi:hypothetical protein